MAVYSLPQPLYGYFYYHRDYLEEHATDPDMRRYAVPDEAARHYIDLEYFGDSVDSLPFYWSEAAKKYPADSLKRHGILPWHLQRMMFRLSMAFRQKDDAFILQTAADLGHYVGDAHVPLHCTRNYNGQLSGQKGIHGLWESRLPDLFHTGYSYTGGKASYISNPSQYIFSIIRSSAACRDSVLRLEKELSRRFAAEDKYVYESSGRNLVRKYSQGYCIAYDSLLQGMVERRLRMSIRAVADLWFTAWVDAGMPKLKSTPIRSLAVTDSLKGASEAAIHGHSDD